DRTDDPARRARRVQPVRRGAHLTAPDLHVSRVSALPGPRPPRCRRTTAPPGGARQALGDRPRLSELRPAPRPGGEVLNGVPGHRPARRGTAVIESRTASVEGRGTMTRMQPREEGT